MKLEVVKQWYMVYSCPKCNTSMKKTKLVSFRNAHVAIRKEQSTLFGPNESSISSYVCPDCGYIELYADKPEKFLDK